MSLFYPFYEYLHIEYCTHSFNSSHSFEPISASSVFLRTPLQSVQRWTLCSCAVESCCTALKLRALASTQREVVVSRVVCIAICTRSAPLPLSSVQPTSSLHAADPTYSLCIIILFYSLSTFYLTRYLVLLLTRLSLKCLCAVNRDIQPAACLTTSLSSLSIVFLYLRYRS